MPSDIVVLAPSLPLTTTTHVRSTLVASSFLAVRQRGLDGRYFEHLPSPFHQTILTITPGEWLPIELGVAHYGACDSLGLTPHEQFEIGAQVGARLFGTWLGTLVRIAKGVGVTPWTGLAQYGRLHQGLFRGGGIAVHQLGPKEARVDLLGLAFARFGYFRNVFRGNNHATVSLFSRRSFISEMPALCSNTRVSLRLAWA